MDPLLATVVFTIGLIINKIAEPKYAHLCIDMPYDVLEVIALHNQDAFSLMYRTCHTLRTRLRKLIPQAMVRFAIPDIEWPGIVIYPNGRRYGVYIRRANLISTIQYRCERDWTIQFDHVPRYLDYKTKDECWTWDTRDEIYTYIRINTPTDNMEYKFDGFNWRYIKDGVYIGHNLPTEYRNLSRVRYNIAKRLAMQYCEEIVI